MRATSRSCDCRMVKNSSSKVAGSCFISFSHLVLYTRHHTSFDSYMSPSLIEKLSDRQVVAEAHAVAKAFCYSEPVTTRIFDHQGMFSKTALVTLEDGSEVIVQLKDNEIDTTVTALARGLLGEIVPFIFSAQTSRAHYAYVADFIKGTMWFKSDTTLDQDVGLASQLGGILARCLINTDSSGVVDFFIVPRLKRILSKDNIVHTQLKSKIEALLNECDVLKCLPLALCHIDINARNVNSSEFMCPLPFQKLNLSSLRSY